MWMLLISLLCVSILAPISVWCLDSVQKRDAFITTLPKGETFDNDGATYVWLPTLGAVKTESSQTASTTNEAGAALHTDSSNSDFVEQKGLFTVYRRSFANEPAIHTADKSPGSTLVYPVVLNIQTYSIGIITGKLWLKLEVMQDAEPVAADYSITLSFINSAMSTAFYEIPKGEKEAMNILVLRKRLQADSRILDVTLDMVDQIRNPR